MEWETIADFLVRKQLDQSDRTFFSGIEQIPAGSAFELDFGGQIEISQFWSLTNLEPFDFDDPIEAYGEIFEDAVRLRTRSDVPIGVFLSGGVDSTAILCSLARTRDNLPIKDQGRFALNTEDS